MKTSEAIVKVSAALKRAAAEHGIPNSFECGFLQHYHGGPPPLIAGRLGKYWLVPIANLTGFKLNYADGRFTIEGSIS